MTGCGDAGEEWRPLGIKLSIMQTRKRILLAAGLAGVALIAGFFVAFRGRDLVAGREDALLGMRPVANGFAVVELFTSEGCSSCPSADALVAAVQKENKDQPVYILAFHVDYWDRLGWKDAFSDAAYSDRQRAYAGWLGLSSIYTPQVVVNGRKEFVGSDAVKLRQAISSGLQETPKAMVSLGEVKLTGNVVRWQAHAEGAGRGVSLLVAVVERQAETKVKAGENGGKTLSHVQIVRSLVTMRLDEKGNGSGQLEWPAGVDVKDGEVIALVQDQGSGQIIAATRAVAGQ